MVAVLQLLQLQVGRLTFKRCHPTCFMEGWELVIDASRRITLYKADVDSWFAFTHPANGEGATAALALIDLSHNLQAALRDANETLRILREI